MLWLLDRKRRLTGGDPNAEKDWEQEKRGVTKDEMVAWHHQFNRRGFEQTPGDVEGQGRRVCCSPWGWESQIWLSNWTTSMKTMFKQKTCSWMFIAFLFIIVKTWKQSRCPWVGEWINKPWYIQTMAHYSELKRKELSSHEKTRRKVKCISPSDRSQLEKVMYYVIPTIWHSGNIKTMETVKKKNQCLSRVGSEEGWTGRAQVNGEYVPL